MSTSEKKRPIDVSQLSSEQLQNELTDLDKLLAQSEWSGCERYVRVDFVERVPEGVDVICKTEHLALYFPSGQEED